MAAYSSHPPLTNGRFGTTNGGPSSSAQADAPMSLEPHHEASDSASQLQSDNRFQSLYDAHNETIVNHLYISGFQSGNYADTLLHAHQRTYRMHAIILSRSPYLVHLMSTSPQVAGQRVVYVNLDHEPDVTQDGFAIALGYLYSPTSLGLVRPDNARGVLAAGCLLGGMDDLCTSAYEACRESINLDTMTSWLSFVDATPSGSNGTASAVLPSPSVFGSYAQRLRNDVLDYLMVTLPSSLDFHRDPSALSSGPSTSPSLTSNGRETLLQIYSQVPFELFKTAVESPAFQIGSEQARFQFAKDAIQLRKRGIARNAGVEEAVVLAFGGGNTGGSAVHVTRKIRRKPLWKVNAA